MKQVVIPAAFNPAGRTVDFSNVAGFNPARLLAIINSSSRTVILDPTSNGLGIASLSGAVVTLQANVSAQLASDRLIAFYDDGQSPATAAAQPALSADGGALSHVTNFPSTQTIAGVVTSNDGGAAVSGAALPSGGSGLTGWLSAIWARLSGTLSVSWTAQNVGVSSLPPLPSGSNTIGAVAQSGGPWTVSWSGQSVAATQSGGWSVTVNNFPATQPISAASLPLPTGAATSANQPALNADGGALAHVTNFPASQAVSWSGQSVGVSSLPSLPSGSNTIGSVNVANFPLSQVVSDSQSAPFSGAVAMTAGTVYAAQRSLGVWCTTSGNVQMQFSDGSNLTLPVTIGWQTFPFAVTQIIAGGTTATASYFNLK